MDSLPDAILQYILSHLSNARDVASCNCVSHRFHHSTPFIHSLYFPRNAFDFDAASPASSSSSDTIINNMIAAAARLESLIVYSSFSAAALKSWVSLTSTSLRRLELRMDSLSDKGNAAAAATEAMSKLECIDCVKGLEELKLWGVLMTQFPNWTGFFGLRTLEIVGARLKDEAVSEAIKACPNLRVLALLGCDGIRSVSIELLQLEQCRLDFYGQGNAFLSLNCPMLHLLEVQGCSWIQVNPNHRLTNLTIANNGGRVYKVDFGKLNGLEFLSIRGIQWCWDAVSSILQCASEVKHLVMKIEFTGDFDVLQSFPQVDLVDFFNTHSKLERFEIHGAMFAALCQKYSLKSVDSRFTIPCLEEVVVTVRSPLNAEQKISTLESLLRYGKKLKRLSIKILQMKNSHSSTDEFFEEVCKFRSVNAHIVRIE
ncbi:hypothetical protein Scep_019029 [Stephania cephalantha]|uniref:F-box domain-containing protein n=1 Tax=Stephania cephalantha TaxID=152367 RepID=A0AAP0IAC3_9MAGN